MISFDDAYQAVMEAAQPTDIFGPPLTRTHDPYSTPSKRYREHAKALHPDVVPTEHHDIAVDAFSRLGQLWDEYLASGVFVAKGRSYQRLGKLYQGDIANLYLLQETEKGTTDTLLKLARNPSDNDLIRSEAWALTRLREHGDAKFSAYVPKLTAQTRHLDQTDGAQRRGNVINHQRGFHSLTEVLTSYPEGLDGRDVAWMWRRLLVGIGQAHHAGVVHGAVLPDHVLIQAEDHGLVLIDWCYSTHIGGKVPAMVAAHSNLYAPEISQKKPADEATDIYMASACMAALLNVDAPKRLHSFARGCMVSSQAARPHHAWRLLSEFDELLHDLYGPRKFRPFHMPPSNTH